MTEPDDTPKALHGVDADPWHFPRAELARRVHLLLAERLQKGVVLFAARRTGKSQFLTHDLGPRAEASGHVVVYANFWAEQSNPVGVLIRALEAAERSMDGFVARARRAAADALKGVEAKLAMPLISVSVGKGENKQVSPLVYIDRLLQELADTSRPCFLLLDEVQTLAAAYADKARNSEVLAALRTSIETAAGGIAPVFTGSSDQALRKMFDDSNAAFFRFAVDVPFEPLGEAFVKHICAKFTARTGEPVSEETALAAFIQFDRSPKIFRDLFSEMLLDGDLSLEAAVQRRIDHIERDDRLVARWAGLKPLDQAVFDFFLEGGAKPYAKASLARIALLGDLKDVTAGKVQTSVKRLIRLQVLDAGETGDPAIRDLALKLWRARETASPDDA